MSAEPSFPTSDDRPQKAVLAGLVSRNDPDAQGRPLEELAMLADTAGAVVAGVVVQKARRVNPKTYIGKGKARELAELADEHEADLVIFDNDLSPAQATALEKETGKRVIDRTELILDIFALHARTAQAKIQVELAQLQYSLPRLKRMWTHLGRIRGGIGLRGPGEQQLEEDRRVITKRIADLKKKLSEISGRRRRQVESRRKAWTVSLVGYTNAGKSTLMNKLTGSGVFESNQLFATLDTKTAAWDLGRKKPVLLSDTVGFIKNIPHNLIASFHATLEEATRADLLLHVVDVSAHDPSEHVEAVRKVLDELGCAEKPVILCMNKSDLVRERVDLEYVRGENPVSVEISAKTGAGIDELARMVVEALEASHDVVEVIVDPGNGRLIAEINRRGEVMEQTPVEGGLRMVVRMDAPNAGWLRKQDGARENGRRTTSPSTRR